LTHTVEASLLQMPVLLVYSHVTRMSISLTVIMHNDILKHFEPTDYTEYRWTKQSRCDVL